VKHCFCTYCKGEGKGKENPQAHVVNLGNAYGLAFSGFILREYKRKHNAEKGLARLEEASK